MMRTETSDDEGEAEIVNWNTVIRTRKRGGKVKRRATCLGLTKSPDIPGLQLIFNAPGPKPVSPSVYAISTPPPLPNSEIGILPH